MSQVRDSDSPSVDETVTLAGPDATQRPDARAHPRYTVEGEHGRGGIGRVLRARDRKLGRTVALKELMSTSDSAEDRFDREVRLTARLEHPAIVPVHDTDFWPATGRPFYAMKLVRGRSLRDVIDETVAFEDRLALLPNVLALTEAIAYAHSEGVIHRDLKPSNVLVGGYGETVVIDWGLAKELATAEPGDRQADDAPVDADVTVAGSVVGTPAYMPPEQARGRVADARSDVYALGAILYHLLTRAPPYQGSGSGQVLARVRAGPPEPVRVREPRVRPELCAIVERAMARDPTERYQNASDLAADLKRYLGGQLVSVHRYSWLELIGRWTRRHRMVAVATVLFLIAGVAGAAYFLVRENRLRVAAEQAQRAAVTQRERADRQSLALLEQRGRDELGDGRPHRAAVYLTEALKRRPKSDALRSLVTEALRSIEAHAGRLQGHTRDVLEAAYSPDGAVLATVGTGGRVRIWNGDTGAPAQVLDASAGEIERVTFTADGTRVVTGGPDHGVRVWDLATGAQLAWYRESAYRLDVSAHRIAVTGTKQGRVSLIDLESGPIWTTKPHGNDRVADVEWHPDGHRFASAGQDGQVFIWDARTRQPVVTLPLRPAMLSSLAFDPTGELLAVIDIEVELIVYDASSGEERRRMRLPEGTVSADVEWTGDGRALVVASQDGRVHVVHATSGAILASIDAIGFGKLMNVAVRPGRDEIVTTGVGGVVDRWGLDRLGYRIYGQREYGFHQITGGEWLDGGRAFMVGDQLGRISIYDAESGAVRARIETPDLPLTLASNPDASHIVATGIDRSAPVSMWDMATGERVATFEDHDGLVYHAAASKDHRTIVTTDFRGAVRFRDSDTGADVGAPLVTDTRWSAAAFSPDGAEVALADGDGRVVLYDWRAGQVVREWKAHPTFIQDIEYSHDGRRLVTAGRQDHHATVWQRATGAELLSIAAHDNNLIRAEFSPDDRWLVTVGRDQAARIWDADTGELLRSISGPSMTAQLAPDGERLLTTADFGYLVLWDVQLDTRTPAELSAAVAARSPWRLVEGRLVLDQVRSP